MGISYESGYMQDLLAGVRDGRVPMSLIDRSVAPHSQTEVPAGLFSSSRWSILERAVRIVHQAAHQDLSLAGRARGDCSAEK